MHHDVHRRIHQLAGQVHLLVGAGKNLYGLSQTFFNAIVTSYISLLDSHWEGAPTAVITNKGQLLNPRLFYTKSKISHLP